MKNDDNPQAFPMDFTMGFGKDDQKGMTLRDYFAAKVLQSIISKTDLAIIPSHTDIFVKESYIVADAMLKARLDKPKQNK